jgi:hypothetical protein
MRTPTFQTQDLLKAFRHKKVLTKRELLQAAGCSSMTAWRLLRNHGYYTSYNYNARYYTLAEIPRFDQHGLWAHRRVRFSKWGSLTETIVALVEASQAGMTPEQLQELLHLNTVRPTLARLIQQDRLSREKMHGRLVYFPPEEAARRQQRKRRSELTPPSPPALPPPEHIIALLVEMIQRPQHSPRQWARRLSRRNIRLSTQDIQAVLEHYEIEGKKGLLTS